MLLFLTFIFINNLIGVILCNPVVHTNDGKLKGLTRQSKHFGKKIHVFNGIRYAQPPIGQLRFQKPIPIQKWDDVKDALKFGHKCWQRSGKNLSEDCLFLNIWTPNILSTSSNQTNDTLKPVMVYIHGGGFRIGTGNVGGLTLASHDVVVVSINYRLGIFGFLYGESEEAPGNVGLHDQVLALKWVKNNIKYFGGDPNKVTIFGQSAGSMSVAHHLVSPMSKDLFKRAILESGSAYYYTGKGAVDKKFNLNDAKKFSKTIHGCSDADWLNCLKKIDAEKLNKYNSEKWYVDKPIDGDEFMPENAQKMIKSGKFHKNLDILAGVTTDEGTVFGKIALRQNKMKKVTKSIVKSLIEDKFNEMVYKRLVPKVDGKQVFNFYLKKLFDENSSINQTTLKRAFSAPFGDFIIKCPTYLFAKDYALHSENHQVYFYYLTYNAEDTCLDWMGVCHGAQRPFIFGTPLTKNKSFTKQDLNFSLLVMQIWTTFAKTGKPLNSSNPPDSKIVLSHAETSKNIKWPLFVSGKAQPTQVMVLHPNHFGQILKDPLKDNCDQFWKEHFL